MTLSQLTTRQREVFEFIRDLITNRGYGPTVREIGDNFGISSPNGVMCHLKALEKKGLITREPNMSRAIQITDAYKEERGMPLVGQIAAGNLTEAIEQAERFDFEDWFPQRKNQFALKVKGDSMIEAQIADGDIVDLPQGPHRPQGRHRRRHHRRRRGHAQVLVPRGESHPPAAGQFVDEADLLPHRAGASASSPASSAAWRRR